MADIKFTPKARNANAIPEEPFSNGSLIAATDTGELYVDYNGARMRIGDVITLETEAQRIATLAPLPKLYWVAETGKLWRFADDWVCINPDAIEADTVKADIVQAGRRYYNVATVSSNAYVYEIVIKTRIPKADQASINAIYLYGMCGNSVVNTTIATYWQNDSVKFAWRNMVQAGSIEFEGKVFTYEDDGTEYVGIALLPGTTGLGTQTSIYYPYFQVDFTDLIGSIRDYSKGWTVEFNTVKDSESIIPQTNIMDCIQSKLVTDIYGSATNSEQLAGISADQYALKEEYLPLTGGTLTGTIDGPRAEFDKARVGRLFKNVVSGTYTDTNYELLIKTGVPKLNGNSMPVIHVHGYTTNSIVDLSVLIYWQNNKITHKFAKNNGTWNPTLKAFTYTKDGTDYLGLALIGYSFYLRLTVDLFEQWTSKHDYSTGWTIEKNTSSSTSIVPTDNLTDVPWQALTTDIMGSAANADQLAGVDGELYTCSYVGRIANESAAYYKNLDDAIRHGGYITSGTPGEINCPIPPGYNSTSKLYGKLWVDVSNGTTGNSNNWVWQTWQSTTGAIYRRQQINGRDWTNWVAVATGGLLYPPDNAGINSLGTPTITEISCIPEMLADRLQFFPATKCMAETSTDGTSWTTKTVSASQWNSLLCCNPSYLAGLTWDNGTQLRLTFTYNTYVMLSMLYLYVATGSRLKVVVERYRNSAQDWVELASMGGIVGQPQHVSLWHDAVRFTNTANDSYSSQVRVTLIHEGNSTDTPRIDMLRWKGGYPAVNPNIYNWDPNKNVTFPMTVTAANFIGQWNGKSAASSFDENSTSTIPTCKQIADYVKSLIGG